MRSNNYFLLGVLIPLAIVGSRFIDSTDETESANTIKQSTLESETNRALSSSHSILTAAPDAEPFELPPEFAASVAEAQSQPIVRSDLPDGTITISVGTRFVNPLMLNLDCNGVVTVDHKIGLPIKQDCSESGDEL